jgi:tryptophan synthase alpha chain
MKNIIANAFKNANKENRPALISYTVCGDNNKKISLDILNSISSYLDVVEWGVPHNCPTADGKEIQNSSYRALKNGIKLNNVFEMVKRYKKNKNAKPLILMGYYQMIFNYGEKKFVKRCREAGVNGLIVVDLSYPDNKKFAQICKKNSICFVQLIAPTTSKKRMREIIKISHEMIYMISMISTTGSALKVTTKKIMENYKLIKKISPTKNVAIGFGITEKTIKLLKKADGLVVGSAICKEITKSIKKRQNTVTNVTNVVRKLKNKIK